MGVAKIAGEDMVGVVGGRLCCVVGVRLVGAYSSNWRLYFGDDGVES